MTCCRPFSSVCAFTLFLLLLVSVTDAYICTDRWPPLVASHQLHPHTCAALAHAGTVAGGGECHYPRDTHCHSYTAGRCRYCGHTDTAQQCVASRCLLSLLCTVPDSITLLCFVFVLCVAELPLSVWDGAYRVLRSCMKHRQKDSARCAPLLATATRGSFFAIIA